ncbi:rna-directed dna polymerase from mobile element jockey-like [Limosa lapponica baueri]|uniref:Rna-directed dna polymerase from mobile element jockey-like n=1 Tax=Limosa lapponica baueri TaxID=1758121 RepID=A0A2I0TZ58_LIMLA|nr:rna-directed dna polymerase from mobile element jockey-like [Limosa lapponica baueri]
MRDLVQESQRYLDFRRANFDLFKKLFGEIPWGRDLEVFIAQVDPQESQTLEVTEKVWMKDDFTLFEEDQVRDQLSKLDIHTSMGPDGMHLEKDVVVDSVKGLTEVNKDDICSSSLVHCCGHSITEGQ